MLNIVLGILLSYLLGAIPFAFLLGKLKGIDLRKIGSGNIGATNLARAAGYKIGVPALLLDISKGIIPVVFFAKMFSIPVVSIDTLRLILGLVSISGHNWTIFLEFKGGKGIATSLGVLVGLALTNILFGKVILILVVIWVTVFILSGYVSLASIIAALFLPVFLCVFKLEISYIIFGVVISVLAVFRHRSNISRLLQHKEHRFFKLSSVFQKPKD